MRKISMITTSIFLLFFVSLLFAFANSGNSVQFIVQLIDGSTIVGEPDLSKISVTTSYSKLEIDVEKISQIELLKESPKVKIALKNGDQISGEFELKSLGLKTLFNDVKLKTEIIEEIFVQSVKAELPAALKKGLVLYLSMDEKGVIEDKSGLGNNGIVEGAQFVPNGKIGPAYEFNGIDSKIRVNDSPSLDFQSEFTLSVWIKSYDVTSQLVGEQDIITKTSVGAPSSFSLNLNEMEDSPHDYPRGRFGLLMTSSNSGYHYVYAAPSLKNNAWCHVAAVYNGKVVRIYINGKLRVEEEVAGRIVPNSLPLFIGHQSVNKHSLRDSFYGLIDEVMIYNRALNSKEVFRLFEIAN